MWEGEFKCNIIDMKSIEWKIQNGLQKLGEFKRTCMMRSSRGALDGAFTSRGTTCSSSSLKLRMDVRKCKQEFGNERMHEYEQNSTYLGSKTEMPPLPFIALTYAF
jgi:hypothetical protein